MAVVCYCRVSTAAQAVEGVSLDQQRSRVLAYCESRGLAVAEVLDDAGESGKSLERPGLRRALGLLADGRADGLVVYKLDRLSRSALDFLGLVRSHFGPASGRSLHSVSESIDTGSAGGRLTLGVLMLLAEWERETIVERTRAALAHKRARGERTGAIPFGWGLGLDGAALVPMIAEQRAIRRALDLRAGGLSLAATARALEAEGLGPRGGGSWSKGSLARILAARRLADAGAWHLLEGADDGA